MTMDEERYTHCPEPACPLRIPDAELTEEERARRAVSVAFLQIEHWVNVGRVAVGEWGEALEALMRAKG
jgi:hypothetical protein